MNPATRFFLGVFALVASAALSAADDVATKALPAPQTTGGKPLMQALKERRSVRDFKPDALTERQVSDMLWAAFGMNRPEIDHHTAPSAMNSQDVDVYLAGVDGLYLYEPKLHALKKVSNEDIRSLTTGQDSVKVAPVQLIFVSDQAKLAKAKSDVRDLYSGVDAGAILQNVYLYCASEGLACVVHELDRAPLAKAMSLRPDQRIVVAQAVGWPK